ALQVLARPARTHRADAAPALRNRRAPGARALSRRGGLLAGAPARAARRLLGKGRPRPGRARARAVRESPLGARALPRAAARGALRTGVVRALLLLPARPSSRARARRSCRPRGGRS